MLNQVSLIGNVGKVELTANNGKEFVNFTLAVNERPYKDKNGNDVNKTNWFRVAVFNEHLQKIVKEYVKKGDKLYVQGSLQNSQYTDNNGIVRYNTDIHLTAFDGRIELLTPRKDEASTGSTPLNDAIPF